tara:strand:- start:605 stop:787 length:183 start_codon:yes stop_codon:yes gene_type:complete
VEDMGETVGALSEDIMEETEIVDGQEDGVVEQVEAVAVDEVVVEVEVGEAEAAVAVEDVR